MAGRFYHGDGSSRVSATGDVAVTDLDIIELIYDDVEALRMSPTFTSCRCSGRVRLSGMTLKKASSARQTT